MSDERGPAAYGTAQDESAAHDATGRQGIDAVPKRSRTDTFPGGFHHSREGQVAQMSVGSGHPENVPAGGSQAYLKPGDS